MNIARCIGYVSSTLLILLSLIFMAVLVSLYRPFIKSALYTPAVCEIQTSLYLVQFMCDCGSQCRSRYPCLILYAYIEGLPARKDGSKTLVMLFSDDQQQANVLAAEDTLYQERCSMHVCMKTPMASRGAVETFRSTHGQLRSKHKCYYDPSDISRGAVFKRSYTWLLVFNVFFWPGLAFLSGIFICAGVCYVRRRKSSYQPDRAAEESTSPGSKTEVISGSQLCFLERY